MRLPVALEVDTYDDTVILYAEEQDAVWDVVQSVASAVAPTVLASIARAAAQYNEDGGVSAAAALDAACEDIPERAAITLLRMSAQEAIALGIALQRWGMQLLDGGAA